MTNLIEPALLERELRSSRTRTARLTGDLAGERLLGPQLAIVNPPLWEIGHVAWFQEWWCLRDGASAAPGASILPGADALYDSAKVAHDTRWSLPLPAIEKTRDYGAEVLDRVIRRLQRQPENSGLQYFAQLAVFHEDMHAEAFHYTRQTLGYPDPFPAPAAAPAMPEARRYDVELPGGEFQLGAEPGSGFVFDNEKWAHRVRVAPFRIARVPVTNGDYLAFVEEGGYRRREWWTEAGWAWRADAGAEAPRYWLREGNTRQQRRFDTVGPVIADHPVIHVNWHEAQAYCRYANRRLPTEAEWEYAAAWNTRERRKRRYPWGETAPTARHANLESGGLVTVDAFSEGDSASGCRQLIGNVWEWTESSFDPYPGFVIDPYQEYSQPWFGTHKVLRGASFATTRRLVRNTFRNFYTPDRNDIFAGFRTCAAR
ncbi:MAG: selenoneine synthase SenA [Gammaproteobacteria bacterium]